MGDHADDAIHAGIDSSWGWRRPRRWSPPPKPSNQQVFDRFAREGAEFKAGDRVVHEASGVAGTVISVRSTQVCWRPGTRIKPGGIWVDVKTLRFDI